MSVFSCDFVSATAEACGISGLREDVAAALTQDMEYRLREVIQEAKKFMRHARRAFLTPPDIAAAMRVKNIEPLYGFVGPRPLRFRRAAELDVYYLEDEVLDFEKILGAPLPRLPRQPAITAHWLAIDGVQPVIPQNPPPPTSASSFSAAATSTGIAGAKRRRNHLLTCSSLDGPLTTSLAPLAGATLVAPAKNATSAICSLPLSLAADSISRELQLYYDRISEAVLSPDDTLRAVALASVGSDPGLQALLPYFIRFAQESVARSLRSLTKLSMLVAFIEHLLANTHFFHEPYLHQVIPILLTTVVCRQLGADGDDHWTLRSQSAAVLTSTVKRYADSYPTLLPRVTRTLLIALLDEKKPISSKFGAVMGLSLLGPAVARACLVPHATRFSAPIVENDEGALKLYETYASALAYVHKAARIEKQANLSVKDSVDPMNSNDRIRSNCNHNIYPDHDPDCDNAIIEAYGPKLGVSVISAIHLNPISIFI